jgi:putative FmdB family regulatory protein
MPTYDYGCKACGHEFDKEQRISDKPVKKCPSCGKLQAKRLISKTSFVLKGGGWYSDLYASSDKPSKDAKDSGDSKSDSGSDDKTETTSKSDAKSTKSDAKSGGSKSKKSGGSKKDAA